MPTHTTAELKLALLDATHASVLEEEDATPLVEALSTHLDGADLLSLFPEVALVEHPDYAEMIAMLTSWRDATLAKRPPSARVETVTKLDRDLTQQDNEGVVSRVHATNGEGQAITTFQKVVHTEDTIYAPLVASIERLIVFLSHGAELGAILENRSLATTADTPSAEPVSVLPIGVSLSQSGTQASEETTSREE